MQGIQIYPYISPSGGGMTSSKELADRMERLREDYIKARKSNDPELEARILRDEKSLLLQIGNLEAKQRLEAYNQLQKSKVPRIVRVREYCSVPIDTGRGFKKPDLRTRHVYLDTHEVELISAPEGSGPHSYTIRMRSGREFDVSEDDFNLIERAMRERE